MYNFELNRDNETIIYDASREELINAICIIEFNKLKLLSNISLENYDNITGAYYHLYADEELMNVCDKYCNELENYFNDYELNKDNIVYKYCVIPDYLSMYNLTKYFKVGFTGEGDDDIKLNIVIYGNYLQSAIYINNELIIIMPYILSNLRYNAGIRSIIDDVLNQLHNDYKQKGFTEYYNEIEPQLKDELVTFVNSDLTYVIDNMQDE